MKSISPWFQTVRLLNGIRKTYSEIEANRGCSGPMNRRSADADRRLSTDSRDKSQHGGM